MSLRALWAAKEATVQRALELEKIASAPEFGKLPPDQRFEHDIALVKARVDAGESITDFERAVMKRKR